MMTAAFTVTEAEIERLATPESYHRGHQYYTEGRVQRVVRRGDRIEAEVSGSQWDPYLVTIPTAPGGADEADCTCPYSSDGICKHVVAVLLTCLHEPDRIAERPPLADLLASLDRDQLLALVLALVARYPSVVEYADEQATALGAAAANPPAVAVAGAPPAPAAPTALPASPRPPPPAVKPADVQRQVRSAVHSLHRLRSSEAYWAVGGVVQEVRRIAEQARPHLDAGDVRGALAILEAATEAYLDEWEQLDDSNGEASGLFDDLDLLWAEALLSGELTAAERQGWNARFAAWQKDVEDYGVDDAFAGAQTAAEEGWDAPELQRMLRGEVVGPPASSAAAEVVEWDDAAADNDLDEYWDEDDDDDLGVVSADDSEPWYTRDLMGVRLAVLERQGRKEEYLNLARAIGRHTAYTTMLGRLGRIGEAVDYAIAHLTRPRQAETLAQALAAQGAAAEALRVAEHGLTLGAPPARIGPGGYTGTARDWGLAYERAALARWLRDQAAAQGQPERALEAALIAVRAQPSLEDYLAAQALAGDRWSALRENLLAGLRRGDSFTVAERVAILLHEGLVEDAIHAVDAQYTSHVVLEQVADAAIASHPDWVMRRAREQADGIVEAGKAQYYDSATAWIRRMRDAARAAGREDEWRAYVDDLLARHARKYKLVPMLKGLLP
jgi:uncharacterized Zn finger protein